MTADSILTDLEAVTAALAARPDGATGLLERRGKLLEELTKHTAALTDAQLARLEDVFQAGANARTLFAARRENLRGQIHELRKGRAALDNLSPEGPRTGAQLDVRL